MGPSSLAAAVALPFAFERAQSRLLLGKQLLDLSNILRSNPSFLNAARRSRDLAEEMQEVERKRSKQQRFNMRSYWAPQR
jgi:hypothetical protein